MIASGSAGNPGPSWHAVGTGDFNASGLSDILFQNSSGQVVIWEQSHRIALPHIRSRDA